ncbi:MAG: septal ring lytic transglycosylase RlpA family protein [Candidatus Aminicenantes bacterium]|nr:septal ring lytic transglycosylase RlpA family protein [Candidatus Aminicenantes bacterium]
MRIWTTPVMIGLLLTTVSCSAGKNVRSEPLSPQPAEEIRSSDFYQTGTASWYGDDFQGKLTANGEIYDMHKLTAAHQTLPFNTLLEVENLENGRKVLVRINDRGPFLKDRIIDLSLQAAQRLSMAGKGTAPVALRLVRWQGAGLPEGGPEGDLSKDGPEGVLPADRPAADSTDGECCVQAGAFALRVNAEDLLLTLGEIFPDLRFKVVGEDGMFKVLSESFPAIARCQAIIDRMAEYHLPAFARKPCPGKVE